MKRLVLLFSIGVALASIAYTRPKVLTDPVKVAEIERNMGGRVTPPSNGKSVLFWDTTGKAKKALDGFTRYDDKILHLPYTLKNDSAPSGMTAYKAACSAKSTKTPCVVYIYAEQGAPSLSVFPEDVIGCINITALAAKDENVFEERLQKEIFRAFGLVLGGYFMPQMPCVLEPVYSVEALDTVRSKSLAPIRFNGIIKSASQLDIPVLRSMPYSIAVKQGWAPPPTNDIQKAIWDRAHEDKERGPANGLKIEPRK